MDCNEGLKTNRSGVYIDADEDDGSSEQDELVIIDWLRVMPEFDLSKNKSIKSKVAEQVLDDDMLEERLGLFKKWEKSST